MFGGGANCRGRWAGHAWFVGRHEISARRQAAAARQGWRRIRGIATAILNDSFVFMKLNCRPKFMVERRLTPFRGARSGNRTSSCHRFHDRSDNESRHFPLGGRGSSPLAPGTLLGNCLGEPSRVWWVPFGSEINWLNTETASRDRKLSDGSVCRESSVCDSPDDSFGNCLGTPLVGWCASIRREGLAHVDQKGRGHQAAPPCSAGVQFPIIFSALVASPGRLSFNENPSSEYRCVTT